MRKPKPRTGRAGPLFPKCGRSASGLGLFVLTLLLIPSLALAQDKPDKHKRPTGPPPPMKHIKLAATLFGETVGEVHLLQRDGRETVLTYRSNVLVVRNKQRLKQEAFIEVRMDTNSGDMISSVARRCTAPEDGSAEPTCAPTKTIQRNDTIPSLAAEYIFARRPDGQKRCMNVTDEESAITGPACVVATQTTDESGNHVVDLVGQKLGQQFHARVDSGGLALLEFPEQGARFERTNGSIQVSDNDLFAEPLPFFGDADKALRSGHLTVKMTGEPAALKRLHSVSSPGQKAVESGEGTLTLQIDQAQVPHDPASRKMLDAAALLVAKAAGSHADCQAATAWFVAQANERHWKVKPVIGVAYVDGRFAFHAWAILETPNGKVPVDPLLAQVPADAGHIQLANAGESAGTVLVAFHHGLALQVE